MNGTRNDARLSGGVRKDAGGDRLRSRDVKGARAPCSRAAAFVSVLLLAYAGASHAALGGLPEQFNAEGAAVASTVSSTMSNYVVRDTTLTTGTQVREYIAADGLVFAVTWDGPVAARPESIAGQVLRRDGGRIGKDAQGGPLASGRQPSRSRHQLGRPYARLPWQRLDPGAISSRL